MKPAYPVRSARNALDILLMFRTAERVRVTDVAQHLGVARSTAHRLLAELVSAGFARQDAGSRAYCSGPALVALGLSAVRHLDIRRRAQPHIYALCREVGETVNLLTLEGAHVRFVECVESSQALRVTARTGLLRPAHSTSVGKALCAVMPLSEFMQLYPHEQLEQLTADTVTNRSQLLQQFPAIRSQGYALNLGESDPHLAAIGVVIPSTTGPPRWGLGVSAPLSRMADEATVRRVSEAAKRAAHATWADEASGHSAASNNAELG